MENPPLDPIELQLERERIARFRFRHRLCLVGFLLFAVSLGLMGLAAAHTAGTFLGLMGATWAAILFVQMVISVMVFAFAFRCPACGEIPCCVHYGIPLSPPKRCDKCGARLG